MPNIARMNAMLTATAAGFDAEMKSAGRSVGTFGGIFSSTASKIAGLGSLIGVGFGAHELKEFVGNSIETIDAMKDQAESIGVTTDALSRLRYAAQFAGVGNDALASAIGKMNVNLSKASDDGGAAVKVLEKLGLTADQLTSMSPEQAFALIADRLIQVDKFSDRAADAVAIFGKTGKDLIPVLDGGSAGLKEFYEEADKLGVTISQTDATKVEAAADAMQRVESAIQGIGNRLAIDLAPYIENASKSLTDFATEGEGMGPKVDGAIEMVATGITYAAGTLDLLSAGWYTVEGSVQYVASGILEAVDAVGQGIVSLLNLIPGVNIELKSLSDLADTYYDAAIDSFGNAADAAKSFGNGDSMAKVDAFFNRIKGGSAEAGDALGKIAHPLKTSLDDASAKVDETIAKLKDQIAEFGQGDAGKLQVDLANAGASDEQISDALLLQQQIDALKDQKKAQDDATESAKRYYDETRTPAEKYAAEIERINQLQKSGQLDADTAQRARDDALKTMDSADKSANDTSDAPSGPKLLQAGSQEAASFVASIQRRSEGSDIQSKTLSVAQQSAKTLDKIADNTAKGSTGGATILVVDM